MQTKKITVTLLDTSPAVAAGVEQWIEGTGDLEWIGASNHLPRPPASADEPDVYLIDKAFGVKEVLDWLGAHRLQIRAAAVWGGSWIGVEVLRFLNAGVRGILHRSDSRDRVLGCIRAVANGDLWVHDCAHSVSPLLGMELGTTLTDRELQVLVRVQEGYSNGEIAHELGIAVRTVKAHLKHAFEKKRIRGRTELSVRHALLGGLMEPPTDSSTEEGKNTCPLRP
ncbi:MAG: response regulator transcription factor [Bryobacteraceae bacterium]|nr:response regulator transcription factor [Bryobacteraceae bacterium]